jgi:hypothetical protein
MIKEQTTIYDTTDLIARYKTFITAADTSYTSVIISKLCESISNMLPDDVTKEILFSKVVGRRPTSNHYISNGVCVVLKDIPVINLSKLISTTVPIGPVLKEYKTQHLVKCMNLAIDIWLILKKGIESLTIIPSIKLDIINYCRTVLQDIDKNCATATMLPLNIFSIISN